MLLVLADHNYWRSIVKHQKGVANMFKQYHDSYCSGLSAQLNFYMSVVFGLIFKMEWRLAGTSGLSLTMTLDNEYTFDSDLY